MSELNATGRERNYWRVLPVLPGPLLSDMAQRAEDEGMTGLFAIQVFGPPFIPLSAAAPVTRRIKLATGVAVAAARSPFETAMAARDLDLLSSGRFILGLGSSTPAFVENVYGERIARPLSHMRETVNAIRYIHANAHLGMERFEGEYYRADFSDLENLPPPASAHIPIWIGALREKMTRLAAAEGDGLIGHPMWSVDWALNKIKPAVEDELHRNNRARGDLEINLWLWAAPGPDEKQAIADARETVAFYAGMKDYEPYFEALGFKEQARRIQSGDRSSTALPDEMVRAFVGIGEPDQVREQFEPLWQLADSICVVPPIYGVPPDRQTAYAETIARTFVPR